MATPASESSLRHWWNMSLLEGNIGDRIALVEDQAGSDDLVQNTNNNKPYLDVMGPNELPCTLHKYIVSGGNPMVASGVDITTTPSSDARWTLIIALANDGTNQGRKVFDCTDGTERNAIQLAGADPRWQAWNSSDTMNFNVDYDVTDPLILAVVADGSSSRIYDGGVNVDTGTIGKGIRGVKIGSRISGDYDHFKGRIGEIALFDTALSEEKVSDQISYFTRWTTLAASDGDVSLLDPSILKPSLTDGNGNLRQSLVTSLYSGGIPSNANEIRPGLLLGDKLKPSLLDSEGNLKPGLLK